MPLTPHQDLLVAEVRRVLNRRDLSPGLDGWSATWNAFRQHGWTPGLAHAQELGGAGLTLVDDVLLHEELGASLFWSGSVEVAFVVDILAGCMPNPNAEQLLDRLLHHSEEVALASNCGLPLRLDGAASRFINAESTLVKFANRVDTFAVLSARGKNVELLITPAGATGLASEGLTRHQVDRIRNVRLSQVDLREAARLHLPPRAHAVALQRARVRHAAYLLGICRTAIAGMISRSKSRQQFGCALRDFQAISFRIAELHIRREAATLWCRAAAHALDIGAASHEKHVVPQVLATAAELAVATTSFSIQVHGAEGLSSTSRAAALYRHSLEVVDSFGTRSDLQREAGQSIGVAHNHHVDVLLRDSLSTSVILPSPSVPIPDSLGDTLPSPVHRLIEQQASLHPDAPAVIHRGRELTYRELDALSSVLARQLRSMGVGPEARIGLCFDNSFSMVVSLLAVLKSGAAYVPLDPGYPDDRLARTSRRAGLRCILSTPRFVPRLKRLEIQPVIPISTQRLRFEAPVDTFVQPTEPLGLAYVIYTSGSTGEPKGVMITQIGLTNRVLWELTTYPLTESDRVLQWAPLSFDASIPEILVPLAAGAAVVLPDRDRVADPAYLVRFIKARGVTRLTVIPAMLDLLLAARLRSCRSLRHVFVGGEVLPRAVECRLLEALGVPLHNLYGPTEISIDATAWDCTGADVSPIVPIGRAIANTQVHVLDASFAGVPDNIGGDLYVSGLGVARGYLDDPVTTAERFLPNPFGPPGSRMYQTGDMGRRRRDGAFEFLGRSDLQVKIRGNRVELEEVEAVGRDCPAVRDLAVIAAPSGLGARLVAWIVPDSAVAGDPSDNLRTWLATRLPSYMVPDVIHVTSALPRTSHGKVDREFLSEHVRSTSSHGANDAAGPLPRLFSQVLGRDVGMDDNFFDLGGTSLDAARLAAAIRRELGVGLPLRWLYEAATPRQCQLRLRSQAKA